MSEKVYSLQTGAIIDFLEGKDGEPSVDKLKKQQQECRSDEWYHDWIDGTDLSPVMKNSLKSLVNVGIRIGKYAFEVGKMTLNFTIKALCDYPNTTSGLLIGLILSLTISLIPVIGPAISPAVGPLLISTSGLVGFLLDAKNKIEKDLKVNFTKQNS